jgi:phosphoenolpyruvate---glycerone phosphotransferase subunit DhaL
MATIQVITKDDLISATILAATVFEEKKIYLGELDTAVGDGDHGFNMAIGFGQVKNSVNQYRNLGIGELMKKIGFELNTNIKGSAGAIFGTFYLSQGAFYTTRNQGNTPIPVDTFAEGLGFALEKIKKRGHSESGDCTMIDALQPAWETLISLSNSTETLTVIFSRAADAALKGAKATRNMIGKHGRAKYLGELSIGHIDPGAMSTYYIFKSISDYFQAKEN